MLRSSASTALLLATLLTACGSHTPESTPDTTPEAANATPGFPLELVAESGLTTTLPAPVRRIFPGNAGALDLALTVADPEWIVAINAGTGPYSVALANGVELPNAVELAQFDMESVVMVDPDLILTHAWQTLDKGPFLERLAYPLFELSNGEDFEAVLRDIERLGRALDREQRASDVVAELRARVEALAAVDRSRHEVMTLSGDGSGRWTAGAGTTAASIAALARATHLTSARGMVGHAPVDHEQLLELDPPVMIVPSSDGTLAGSVTWTALSEDERLAGLRVRKGTGLVVPIRSVELGTSTHDLLSAAEALAAALDAAR